MGTRVIRIPIPHGEARCFAQTGTHRTLEIELGGRTLREAWDPRDTDVILYARVNAWMTPLGVALTPEEREAALDGLWSLRQHAGGIRAILTYDIASCCHVAQRWDCGRDGQIVDVRDTHVDVLELGRTARIPAVPTGASPPEADVRMAEARWAHPAGAIMTDADRARLAAKLARSGADDQRIAPFTWRLRPA